MDEARPGYYAVIPADVRYDDQIPPNAKLLYGEISALIGAEGYCYASNQYFSQIYKMSNETISRLISKLEKAGYIQRQVVKDNTGQIVSRKLFLTVSIPRIQTPNPAPGKVPGGIDKKINTPCEKNQEGIDEKVKETNISNTNNTPKAPQRGLDLLQREKAETRSTRLRQMYFRTGLISSGLSTGCMYQRAVLPATGRKQSGHGTIWHQMTHLLPRWPVLLLYR